MATYTPIGFRTALVESLYNEINSRASNYYFFFGRTQEWPDEDSPTSVENTLAYEASVRDDILFLKRITSSNTAFLIPRYDWETGTVYDEHSLSDEELVSKQFYAITEDNNIYKCISNNSGGGSTVAPFGTSPDEITLGDGYIWQFVCSVSGTFVTNFATSSEYPVVPVDGATVVRDLFVVAIAVSVKLDLEDDLNQGFQVPNDYRQVGILKQPLQFGLSTSHTSINGTACYSVTGDFSYADISLDLAMSKGGGAFRVVAMPDFDPSPDPVTLLIQPLTTGTLENNDVLTYGVGEEATLSDVIAPTVDKYSGILMFLDNRASFEATEEQAVQVKTIIRL